MAAFSTFNDFGVIFVKFPVEQENYCTWRRKRQMKILTSLTSSSSHSCSHRIVAFTLCRLADLLKITKTESDRGQSLEGLSIFSFLHQRSEIDRRMYSVLHYSISLSEVARECKLVEGVLFIKM